MAGQLDTDSLLLLHEALARLEEGFAHLPAVEPRAQDPEAMRESCSTPPGACATTTPTSIRSTPGRC